jgi:hypothetical protein
MAIVGTLGQMASNGHQRSSTVYDWPSGVDLSREWTSIGDAKHNITGPGALELGPQQSGAYLSKQLWRCDQPIAVRSKISAWATTPHNKYFAGVAIFNPLSHDTNYFELFVSNGVPPLSAIQGPSFGAITGNGTYEPGVRYGLYAPREWRDIEISWMPSERLVRYTVDGVLCGTWGGQVLTANACLWVGCVSVGELVGDDGSRAKALFGPIEVLGVKV